MSMECILCKKEIVKDEDFQDDMYEQIDFFEQNGVSPVFHDETLELVHIDCIKKFLSDDYEDTDEMRCRLCNTFILNQSEMIDDNIDIWLEFFQRDVTPLYPTEGIVHSQCVFNLVPHETEQPEEFVRRVIRCKK